jgi:hypothetical protein
MRRALALPRALPRARLSAPSLASALRAVPRRGAANEGSVSKPAPTPSEAENARVAALEASSMGACIGNLPQSSAAGAAAAGGAGSSGAAGADGAGAAGASAAGAGAAAASSAAGGGGAGGGGSRGPVSWATVALTALTGVAVTFY